MEFLALYRRVLTLHRNKLSAQKRALGDAYVKKVGEMLAEAENAGQRGQVESFKDAITAAEDLDSWVEATIAP